MRDEVGMPPLKPIASFDKGFPEARGQLLMCRDMSTGHTVGVPGSSCSEHPVSHCVHFTFLAFGLVEIASGAAPKGFLP